MELILGLASLAIIAVSGRLWFRAMKQVEIPKNRVFFIAAWIAAGTLGLLALLGEPGWLGGIPAVLGLLASLLLLATVAIGGQKVGEDVIRVGSAIPAFTALDEHGELFDSESLRGHPVLIKFFRAHW